MIVTCVHVFVKEDHIEDFIKASLKNHKGSIQEAGNLRFDVLQLKENPAEFLLYEAWESEKASAEHKKTPHYLKWRETVADWMAKPRAGVPYNILAPLDKNDW